MPPIWGATGSGVSQQVIAGTPIIPDNTKNSYDIDISSMANVQFIIDNLGFALTDKLAMRLSTDGGATFHQAASDYKLMFMTDTQEVFAKQTRWDPTRGNATRGHQAFFRLDSIQVGRATYASVFARGTTLVASRFGWANFDGPVTDVRLYSAGGNNLNAGAIRMTGILAV